MNNHGELDLVPCPQCAAPAEVVDRFDLPGTDGPVTHVKVQCLHRHWFTTVASAVEEESGRWHRRAA
jgi:hypothetical protein